MNLSGRKTLLTGATGGLGRAIAHVAGRARRRAGAERPQPRGAGGAGRRAARQRPLACFPPTSPSPTPPSGSPPRPAGTEILVANAGLPGAGKVDEFSAEEVKRALRVNLEAPMLLARALYPAMLEAGSGHLVFVASLSGKAASPRSSIYNATKFGLRGFALGLRADLAPHGRRRLDRLAGLHPRRRHVRRRRRQAPAGWAPPPPSRSARPPSRRSSRTRSR